MVMRQGDDHEVRADGVADPLVPPVERMFDGKTSVASWVSVGENWVKTYLVVRAHLKATDRVLDVGSGIGNKARVLTRYLQPPGRYDGFDVVHAGIEWCRAAYREYPHFRFRWVDLYSSHYNAESDSRAAEFRFPYADSSFDLVFLASVFTHLLPEDVVRYFSEVSRVLVPGGRCVSTYFLLNPEAEHWLATGTPRIRVPYAYGEARDCRIVDRENPAKTVAHGEERIRNLHLRAGLTITDVSYGNWCGREDLVGALQDVIVAVR